jgi:prevent-host-death family protein
MAHTPTVGARELKARLGRYLRRVRAGETLLITDRGEPTAELRPVTTAKSTEEAALDRLAARGVLTRGRGGPLGRVTRVRMTGAAPSQAILEDRKDRC